ncbi:MAG: hypothetical protein ACP5QT_08025, partial [Brevinematia bacterium]
MSRKIIFALCGALLIYFSCAAQPGTGGGGGGTSSSPSSSSQIVINPSNPSETLETVPELKLKLKNMPDSLSDNNLKLKSPRFKAVGDVTNFDPATLPDVKSEAWYNMVKTLQQESMAQMMLESLKEMAQYYRITMDNVISLGEGMAVKCVNDGKGGLAYYFTINMMGSEAMGIISKKNPALMKKIKQRQSGYEFVMKMYIDVYPTNGKAAVEFIADYEMNYEGQSNSYRMYSYYNEASGEMIDSAYSSDMTFLWRAWWDSPSSMAILTYYGMEGAGEYMTIGWGNDDYGGVVSRNLSLAWGSTNKDIY